MSYLNDRLGRFCFNRPRLRKLMPDKMFLEQNWLKKMPGYGMIDFNNPQSFAEKLNWLKLYDHNPRYTLMADKVNAKVLVAKAIGEDYIIPTIKTYTKVNEIVLEELPNQFVLKCNHDSGFPVICKDKSHFDLANAKNILSMSLARDFYALNREWPYKNIERRILAEEYVEDDTFEDLVNYKFLCFGGEPKLMYITVKTDDIWEDFFDMDFNPVDMSYGRRKYVGLINRPACFDELKDLSRKLSAGIPFVRVDFYIIKGKIKFSEFTFYDWGGYVKITPEIWDKKLCDWLVLPNKQIK